MYLEGGLKNFGLLKCALNNVSLSIHPKTVGVMSKTQFLKTIVHNKQVHKKISVL
jgi:hypothetical protein